MSGRTRLITGAKMLSGLKVNGLQRNPNSGLGVRANAAGSPGKKKHKVKRAVIGTVLLTPKRKDGPPRVRPVKRHACVACGKRFASQAGRDAHASAVHGVGAVAPRPVRSIHSVTPVRTPPPASPPGVADGPRPRAAKVVCPVCGLGLGKCKLLEHLRSAHSAFLSDRPPGDGLV